MNRKFFCPMFSGTDIEVKVKAKRVSPIVCQTLRLEINRREFGSESNELCLILGEKIVIHFDCFQKNNKNQNKIYCQMIFRSTIDYRNNQSVDRCVCDRQSFSTII